MCTQATQTAEEILAHYHLFATPNALIGAGSVVDLFGNLVNYNYSTSSEGADFDRLLSDWLLIGFDLQSAIEKVTHAEQQPC